ncbi:MAG TPA: glycosyltransferase family 2 protein [Flavitalea sp.]|nr:glycosyltransferase family 2 protein [Flavitalea sp.]
MSKGFVSIIVPLYNEEESFGELIASLLVTMSKLPVVSEVVLVDDGSTDNTSKLIRQIALADRRFHCIFLSRNFGHQLAITAGLNFARGDKGVMIMDGDLQDPPELLTQFLQVHEEGFDVVYSIRKKRKENWSHKIAYAAYYRIFRTISNIQAPLDSGDFCFLSRKVVNILNLMPEEQRYLRGMRSWIGFSQKGIEYERSQRNQGVSKYPLKKLLKLAYMGIFNFSEFPVKFITALGMIATLSGLFYFFLTLIRKFFFGDVPSGFTALIGAIVIFSGVQLISIGILGEYIVRIFYQVKQRPLFLVKERITDGQTVS